VGTPLFIAMGIIAISIASGVAGYLSRFALATRFGSRSLVVFGLLCFATADLWFAAMSLDLRDFGSLVGLMILLGIAQAVAMTPVIKRVTPALAGT
jgi:hypothetical protein